MPVFLLVLVAITGCRPSFDDRESLVTGPRILAVRAEPPEALPGESVSYRALIVTPEGVAEGATVRWAFCAAPKPLTENNSVTAECLGDAVRPIEGTSESVMATTPTDACQLFGPDTPPGDLRPRDPDETGGFYQPVRLQALGETAFTLERIRCNLPNAPLDVAVELGERYVPNRNPTLLPLRAFVDNEEVALDALPAGRNVRFEIGWTADDVEAFVAFDPVKQGLVNRREGMRVFWYATGGAFANDVTGRAEEDAETTASNVWTAPAESRAVTLWVVLRDSRGGMDFATNAIELR